MDCVQKQIENELEDEVNSRQTWRTSRLRGRNLVSNSANLIKQRHLLTFRFFILLLNIFIQISKMNKCVKFYFGMNEILTRLITKNLR
jgi:hypothetical protein